MCRYFVDFYVDLMILYLYFFQGTYAQYDPIIQQIIDAESSIYTSIPSTIEAAMPDFLSSVDSMFDSVMSASLSTANFDLICYLNGQNKYEPWYTNIAYNCIVDRNYTLDNATFWHDAYLAAIPELNQLFVDAKAAVAARPECGPNDQDSFAQSISSNITYPTYSFQQLLQAIGYSYGLVPTDLLYGFSSELSVIFSNAQNDPAYDAIGAIEDVSKLPYFLYMTSTFLSLFFNSGRV